MITIAILTKNRRPFLQRLLDNPMFWTATPSRQYRVIVLNQGSTDDTAQYLASLNQRPRSLMVPELTIWNAPYNSGCAGGRQRIVDRIRGTGLKPEDIIVFLDDDLQIDNNLWLVLLTRPIVSGMVGISGQVGSRITADYWPEEQAGQCYVDFVGGGWCAIKGDVFLSGIDFDLQFNPNYWEDADLCTQAREKGFKVYATGPIGLLHKSASENPQFANALYEANRVRYLHKWGRKNA